MKLSSVVTIVFRKNVKCTTKGTALYGRRVTMGEYTSGRLHVVTNKYTKTLQGDIMTEYRGFFVQNSAKRWVFSCSLWCFIIAVSSLEPNQAWGAVFLAEHFESLARWHVQPFGDKPSSHYSAVLNEGHSCLLMESNNSASLLVLNQEFNVYEYPKFNKDGVPDTMNGWQCTVGTR